MGQKQDFIEVSRGSETLLIVPSSIVAVQTRGETHLIHTTGGPITVSREVAADVREAWKKLGGEGGGKLFARQPPQ